MKTMKALLAAVVGATLLTSGVALAKTDASAKVLTKPVVAASAAPKAQKKMTKKAMRRAAKHAKRSMNKTAIKRTMPARDAHGRFISKKKGAAMGTMAASPAPMKK